MRAITVRVCTVMSPATSWPLASIGRTPERNRKPPARTALENGMGRGVAMRSIFGVLMRGLPSRTRGLAAPRAAPSGSGAFGSRRSTWP